MKCKICGEPARVTFRVRGTATLMGAGAGGYVAATAGGKTGAAIGSLFCPGFGTAIGGLLGVLTRAAAGAVAGNTVGRLLDKNVLRIWHCESCGFSWRAV